MDEKRRCLSSLSLREAVEMHFLRNSVDICCNGWTYGCVYTCCCVAVEPALSLQLLVYNI